MKTIKIRVPFDINLSKNKKFIGRTKKVLNPKYAQAKKTISFLFQEQLRITGLKPKKGKCVVDIHVFKPNMKSDAQNMIEGVCDALKVCLDFGDNYFSGAWDWHISKECPAIIIYFSFEVL